MMPGPLRLLGLTSWAVLASSEVQEHCDAFAAVQGHVRLHRPRVVAPTLQVVDQALSQLLNQTEVMSLERRSESTSLAHVLSLEWRVFEAEPGSAASLHFDHGCAVLKDGNAGFLCTFSQETRQNVGHMDLQLSEALDESAKFEATVEVSVLFIHQKLRVSCGVCGAPCSFNFMGKTIDAPAMPPCPIPAGSWIMDLPFDGVKLRELTQLPLQGTLTVTSRLKRGNGTTVLSFKTKLSI